MVPTLALFQRSFVLLGADSTTLNKSSGTPNVIMLLKAPFTPSANLDIGTLTEADFTGYLQRAVLADGLPQSLDPATGDSLLSAPALTLGYLWETTDAVNLPQTIYGYALVNDGATVLYASALLPQGSVTLTMANQSVSIPIPVLRQLAGSVL